MVDNRNITDHCIGRKGLYLNFSGTIQLAKNFVNFVKGFSGISNPILEPEHPLTLFSEVAFERSKITAILSVHDISHSLSRNISGSASINCQSVEDNFKDTLKKLRINNLNRVIISQININSIRNKIELSSKAVLGNIDILMVSEIKIDMPLRQVSLSFRVLLHLLDQTEQILVEEYSSLFEIIFLPNY